MCGETTGRSGVDNSRGLDHLVTYCSAVTVKFLGAERGGYIYHPFKMPHTES